jgi:hypothetical protein
VNRNKFNACRAGSNSRIWIYSSHGSTEENLPMIQRRLRVAKWSSTTPALGVCTVCSQEFKVPMSTLKRVVDAQASLQGQFDSHQCEPEDMSRGTARGPADVRLREDPEEDEEEDDPKKNEDNEDDEDDDDGYSESPSDESNSFLAAGG